MSEEVAPSKHVMRVPIEQRFHRHYVTVPEAGCWLWVGSSARKGYGTISSDSARSKSPVLAHRLSYAMHHGPIPKGMFVCHKCDTPSCVNPAHLFLGYASENTVDAKRKGRLRVKLTSQDALDIRASTDSISTLSDRFSVSKTMVRYIKSGKCWDFGQKAKQ